jgi:uncharacterized protein YndB with AHSA1/START domain
MTIDTTTHPAGDKGAARTSDRIEKSITLRAPRARVWKALTTASEFGAWFRVNLESEIAVGQTVHGRITHPGFEHLEFEMQVERMEPESYFSYRWHPYAVDPAVDYTKEPTTLVEFRLDEEAGGTRLQVIESGFDRIPAGRRAEAFRMNDGGWAAQMTNIQRHVEG